MRLIAFFIVMAMLPSSCAPKTESVYQDRSEEIEERVIDLVARMTLEEKISMLDGAEGGTNNYIRGNERLGIPEFPVLHGPIGMKCRENGKMTIGTYFPVSIAMAATFDDEAVQELGDCIGKEVRAIGGLSNAGPAMNIIRDPRTGRSFEYFTEDPYLNGRIATANVKGQQSSKIGTILKHFACNNQELDRYHIDVNVSERALREIYLPGFERAVKEGDAKIIMSAYNLVNGDHCSESAFLLDTVLRQDWGFDGFVMSDWGGTHSTVKMAECGMDLEMPRAKWYGKKLLDAVKNGSVSEETVDRMVSNILRVMFWTEVMDSTVSVSRDVVRSDEHLRVAREVSAKSMVLLKNDRGILPLDQDIRKIAVIGPNGEYGKHFREGKYNHGLLQGGGSSSLATSQENMVTPYRGISENAPEGVDVKYAPGCYAESGYGPIPVEYLYADGNKGISLDFYGTSDFKGRVIKKVHSDKMSFVWAKELDIPEEHGNVDYPEYSVRLRTELSVPEDGEYGFEVRNESGSASLYIDGKLVAENLKGNRVYWHGTGNIDLKAGKKYSLEVRYVKIGDKADLSINWDYENKAYLKEALELASESDVVILTVGLSGQMGETEAGDRLTLDLAPAQERLIREVAKVNRNCTAVIVAGSAVTMDSWIDYVPSVLFAWYPGEQGGNALADILFGKVSPAGRLPITFPASDSVYPSDFYCTDRKGIDYNEDIFVGYRYFDRYDKEILFPFGHGLSYTDFNYSGLDARPVKKNGKKVVKVSLNVENIGSIAGDEVVQIYVSDPECSVERPEKELKEFRRISLRPGEQKKISFELDERAFSFWDDSVSGWTLEPGMFVIKAGSSSEDIRCQTEVML